MKKNRTEIFSVKGTIDHMEEICENCVNIREECEDSRLYPSDSNNETEKEIYRRVKKKFKFIFVAVTELPKQDKIPVYTIILCNKLSKYR